MRPGAYGVVGAQGRVLVVKAPQGFYLPGGGIDAGESPPDAVRREFVEETGYEFVFRSELGCVEQVARSGSLLKVCWFYSGDLGTRDGQGEDDHEVLWLPVDEAREAFAEDAHRWAVARFIAGDANRD